MKLCVGVLIVVVTGCVTAAGDGVDRAEGELAGDGDAIGDGAAIGVLGGGLWFRDAGCPSPDPSSCLDEGHFWIDLAVRNDAYDKRVGVVWIDEVREDAAAPWHVAEARYEATLDGGGERWGVDVTTGVYGGNEPAPRIRFAAFAEMAGTTHWDNHGGADHVLPLPL